MTARVLSLVFIVATVSVAARPTPVAVPTFTNVTVHDPSVVRAGSDFYVFGSHLASARTNNGLRWIQISTDPSPGSPLAPDAQTEFQEALA